MTPLSLRRFIATTIAGMAGAAGEVLIDTTNQRAVVSDASTLGGFPQAQIGDLPGRNAIINGNFAINQRGYASGGSLAAGAYAHDRWKAGANGCAYTFSQANADTAITITSGTLVQAIDVGNVYASSVWLTWQGTATARVWQGTASGAFSAGVTKVVGGVTVNALLVTGLALGTVTSVEFGTGTLGLVQVEAALPNAGPTRFERRQGELAICQRYYFTRIPTGSDYFSVIANGQTYLGYGIDLPTTMRATPTVTVAATTSGTFVSGFPSVQLANPGRIYLRGDTTLGQYTVLTSVTASAEL